MNLPLAVFMEKVTYAEVTTPGNLHIFACGWCPDGCGGELLLSEFLGGFMYAATILHASLICRGVDGDGDVPGGLGD